jgi:hypothetical protein
MFSFPRRTSYTSMSGHFSSASYKKEKNVFKDAAELLQAQEQSNASRICFLHLNLVHAVPAYETPNSFRCWNC